MKLIFNGTSAAEGFPAVFCECKYCRMARKLGGKNIRTRSSCAINGEYLIDFPPDTYMHSLCGSLKLSDIKHVVITHHHKDHFAPNDLFMSYPPFAYPDENSILHIYGNEKVYEKYKQAEEEEMIDYTRKYLNFTLINARKWFTAGEAKIFPLKADHGNLDENCYIYVINIGEKYLLYGHDSGYFPEETWEALETFKNFKLNGVILDCTNGKRLLLDSTSKKTGLERWHMGIFTNLKVKERMVKQGIAGEETIFIITHFSHNCGPLFDDMAKLAEENGFTAAYDGMSIEI
jgi:phosphoribosyl 1,2-cyclic phosphate phosphodiesterase